MEISDAIIDANDITRMSLSLTWAISCAMTPSSSSSGSISRSPLVATTAASFGFLPVANAFGVQDSTMPTSGMGRLYFIATVFTVLYRRGSSYWSTILALLARSAFFLHA